MNMLWSCYIADSMTCNVAGVTASFSCGNSAVLLCKLMHRFCAASARRLTSAASDGTSYLRMSQLSVLVLCAIINKARKYFCSKRTSLVSQPAASVQHMAIWRVLLHDMASSFSRAALQHNKGQPASLTKPSAFSSLHFYTTLQQAHESMRRLSMCW